MKLHLLDFELGVLHLAPDASVPDYVWSSPFYSITRTQDELSLFLAADCIPEGEQASRDWRAFHVVGHLDFEVVGIISSLTMPLAAKQISVFSISTHDTDYLVVPADRLEDAIDVLTRSGHRFV